MNLCETNEISCFVIRMHSMPFDGIPAMEEFPTLEEYLTMEEHLTTEKICKLNRRRRELVFLAEFESLRRHLITTGGTRILLRRFVLVVCSFPK